MAGDPEVLQEHVAGEDIRGREVLDRLTEVEHGPAGGRWVRFAQVEVQRAHAPLDVEMPYHHPVAFDGHRVGGLLAELGEQLGGEAIAGKGQVLELLGVDQAPGPIMPEHELVALEHLAPRRLLGIGEPVPDHLEDDIV